MSMQAAPPVLEVNNIEVVYHHTIQALRGLSLSVPAGGIVALLGSNGAGKSTTLKAVSGLLPLESGAVTAGKISFLGQDIAAEAPHKLVRRGLFHVMEGRRIFADLTVEENLLTASYALTGRREEKPDYDKVFHFFPRLAERRRATAGYLSGGEQQMLAIGRALVARPRMMLLDEPSLGLAPMLVEEIFAIVERINREEGVAMLLVEQNATVALAIAQYGYIMETGRIVIDGPSEKLRGDRDVQEFYLGLGHDGASARNFRDIKHYKRRKRWLS